MASFLFVQTAFNYHDVALIENGTIKKSWHIAEPRQTLKFLMETLAELQELTFDHIVFVQGPGSFTALRVGATWVNTLAYTRNVKIRNISTLAYIALALDKKIEEINVTFDAKRYFFVEQGNIVVVDHPHKQLFQVNTEETKIEFNQSIAQKLSTYSFTEAVEATDVLYVLPPKITLPK